MTPSFILRGSRNTLTLLHKSRKAGHSARSRVGVEDTFTPSLLQLAGGETQFAFGGRGVFGFGRGDHFLNRCFQAGFHGLITVMSFHALLIAFLF
jgi:hypothetical protein